MCTDHIHVVNQLKEKCIAFVDYKKAYDSEQTWKTRGLRIDSEYLSHLRFADDIFICIRVRPKGLQQMLQEQIADESKNRGLTMINSKTKVMTHKYTTRKSTLKATSIWDRDTAQEKKNKTMRRITAGWTTFAKHRDLFKITLEHAWRDIYVLPVIT